jgi:hypothetical protein
LADGVPPKLATSVVTAPLFLLIRTSPPLNAVATRMLHCASNAISA